jgi:hypothetical protein
MSDHGMAWSKNMRKVSAYLPCARIICGRVLAIWLMEVNMQKVSAYPDRDNMWKLSL